MKRITKRGFSTALASGALTSALAEFGSEAGQTLVELALVLPLLLTLIMGAVDLGRLVYMAVGVANAAHAGAQYGCQNPASAVDFVGIQAAATNDAGDLVGASKGNLAATAANFCQCADGTSPNSSCSTPPACASTHLVQFVSVSTTASYSPWIPYPGIPSSVTVHGSAVMEVQH